MSMGMPIGYCMLLSQNNATNTLYEPWVQGTSQVHISLHGDPTLRLSPVKPVSNLGVTPAPGKALLSWNGSSDDSIQGYYVYRAPNPEGPYTRLTDSVVGDTSFSDSPAAGSYYYMVRAIKLERSGGGSYLNPSQGMFAGATVSGSPPPEIPSAPVLQAQPASPSEVNLQWNSVSNAQGYELERQNPDGSWSQISRVGTTSYSDGGLSAASTYKYRVRAFDNAGESAYSSEVTVTTQPGIISDKPLTLSLSRTEGGLILTLRGDSGQHFKIQSSQDLQGWQDLTSGALSGPSVDVPLSAPNQPGMFVRAVNTH